MKPLLSLIACCVLFAAVRLNAQEYSPNRWKETMRLNPFDQDVPYTDTVLLNTTDRQVVDIIIGGYAYRGTVDGDSLNVKKRTFHVVKNEPGEIRLKFNKLTHIFTRELKGTAGADAESIAEQNKIPETPLKKVNTKQLYGTWMVYKKTLRDGATIDVQKAQYFKKMYIFAKPVKGFKGSLHMASNNLVMNVKEIKGSEIKYLTTLNQPKSLKVLKQSASELLLEDEQQVIYFFKKY